MSAVPQWFEQLKWSQVWSVAALATDRSRIPRESGCYVFTEDAAGLRPDHVLYVGKAKNLRSRLGGYLVNYRNTRPTKHKGRAFIFEQRDKAGDYATFVRWAPYGGNPAELETNLCEFLWPDCTDVWEKHELWDDDEEIDPRLLG
jgi:hypothetical protein